VWWGGREADGRSHIPTLVTPQKHPEKEAESTMVSAVRDIRATERAIEERADLNHSFPSFDLA
jgi:hypothetical protein